MTVTGLKSEMQVSKVKFIMKKKLNKKQSKNKSVKI